MLNAKASFASNLNAARNLGGLYDFLSQTVNVPLAFDDLLRAQVVYAMSAYDKLIHDLIRIGMVEIFVGRRIATQKYHTEAISLEFHAALVAATLPPKEVLFEYEIVRKLGFRSFQDPAKLADGLSLIWQEPHKWERIAAHIGMVPADARTKMKLIADRRNAIVHESDIDPVTNVKTSISRGECNDVTHFIDLCGNAIVDLLV